MNTTIKLVGFVVGITVMFFATYLIGTAVGPIGDQAPVSHEHAQMQVSHP
ncbi:hypothetical protein QMK17_13810 [Rhodococcus sp. G-MC3]|nr:hypothetical protein [Rhodococcus sp. G-MC3]MDJ0394404.1 hypothetical protein [Rhodococcus sp. G-MC3]